MKERREVKILKKIPLAIIAGLIILVLAASAVSFAATSKGNQPPYGNQTIGFNQKSWQNGACDGNCYNGKVERRTFAGKRSAYWAEALGITAEEFTNLRSQGKTVEEIAKSRGVSLEEVIDKVLEKDRQYLDTLVRNGQITEEDAERILQFRKQRLTERATQKPGNSCLGKENTGCYRGSGGCCGR